MQYSSKKKRVVFIAFYDRICLGARQLSKILRTAGHETYLVFLKEDRIAAIEHLKQDNLQYQMLWKNKLWGCGLDVNPVTKKEWRLLTDLVEEIDPQVVAVSSRSMHQKLACQTADLLRKRLKRASFLAGGFGPTITPQKYLESFDYVCLGEGDLMIRPFVETDDPKKVPNLAWRENGGLTYSRMAEPVDMDTQIPFSDWDERHKYMVEDNTIQKGNSFLDPSTYDIFASRGCPAACTYCMACQWGRMLAQYGLKFPKVRLASPERVISELVYAKKEYNIHFVRFRDDIFGLTRKWTLKFMDLYDKKVGLPFSCILDERYADRTIVSRLVDSGLHAAKFGIQSANEKVRREILNRRISDSSLVQYADMLLDVGIKQLRYDIIGFNPFETEETLLKGLDLLRMLPKSHDVKVGELKVFPGSPLFDMLSKHKTSPLNQDDYFFWALIYVMVLFSRPTEELALELLQKPQRNLEEIKKKSQRAMDREIAGKKLVLITNLEKDRRLMGTHLDLINHPGKGIKGDDLNKVIGLKLNKPLSKGEILTWDDLKQSYEGISYG